MLQKWPQKIGKEKQFIREVSKAIKLKVKKQFVFYFF